jgi:hypothetical protein
MEPNWPNPREDRAWRALMHAHHQLGVHLNQGLQESGLSAADHEILAVLSDHDGDSMPARDLCNTLGWEKSRASHQASASGICSALACPQPGSAAAQLRNPGPA